jgi:hypothetical protein
MGSSNADSAPPDAREAAADGAGNTDDGPDPGSPQDASTAEGGDASPCPSGTATVQFAIAEPVPITYCDWEIFLTGTTGPYLSGIATFPTAMTTFNVACIPAGAHHLSATCGPYSSPLGECRADGDFSVTSGTMQVLILGECPA